jgi:hypothetical protein
MKTRFLLGLGLTLAVLAWLSLNPSAQAAPAAQLTPFPTPTPGPDGRIIYIVQEGDTIWRIAAICGFTSVDPLYELNKWGPNQVIKPGDQVIIGFAGPVSATPTPGPTAAPQAQPPTPTPALGWGILCVVLYDDLNGDSMRQEDEPPIPGGAISVSNRAGSVLLTADSTATDNENCNDAVADISGFVEFYELPKGQYNVSVAAPAGYNPTTEIYQEIELGAGDTSYMAFGAQANSETVVEQEQAEIIPTDTPRRSPVLGILGGIILILGLAVGVYATVLARAYSKKQD